jgi:hypothetical protein
MGDSLDQKELREDIYRGNSANENCRWSRYGFFADTTNRVLDFGI